MLNFSFSSRSLSREYTFLFLFSKVENIFSDFSFSSRNWGKEIHISLSPLEIGEINFIFLFLLSKLEKLVSDFSFSSRKWRNWFQISLSPLDWTFLPLVNHCLNMHLQDVASGATSFPPSRLDQAHHLGFKVQRKATPSYQCHFWHIHFVSYIYWCLSKLCHVYSSHSHSK